MEDQGKAVSCRGVELDLAEVPQPKDKRAVATVGAVTWPPCCTAPAHGREKAVKVQHVRVRARACVCVCVCHRVCVSVRACVLCAPAPPDPIRAPQASQQRRQAPASRSRAHQVERLSARRPRSRRPSPWRASRWPSCTARRLRAQSGRTLSHLKKCQGRPEGVCARTAACTG